jgi:hypothetical protein
MADKTKVRPPFVHTEKDSDPAPVAERKTESWPRQQLGAFDWKSAASLRAPTKPGEKALRAWDATEWDAPAQVSEEARRVAEQIDSVVQRIRKGELSIDGKAPTPETAMAAALEALIRSR